MNQDPPRILLVDDDANLLAGLRRQLGWDYEVCTALSGAEGLDMIDVGPPFALVISDMRMPGMDGATFLSEVRRRAPRTTRLLLTGYAELEAAIEAVNRAAIFRFLVKPCPPETLLEAIEQGIEQNRLLEAEVELLELTLRGSVQMLADTLALAAPEVFVHCSRVRRFLEQMLMNVRLPDQWPLTVAAVLIHVPLATLPDEQLRQHFQAEPSTREDPFFTQEVPSQAIALVAGIPRLEKARSILRYLSTEGAGGSPITRDTVVAAELLSSAVRLDLSLSRGAPLGDAITAVHRDASITSPPVVRALGRLLEQLQTRRRLEVRVNELTAGMVVEAPVRTTGGMTVIGEGHQITEALRLRIVNYGQRVGVQEPLQVSIDGATELSGSS